MKPLRYLADKTIYTSNDTWTGSIRDQLLTTLITCEGHSWRTLEVKGRASILDQWAGRIGEDLLGYIL